jgi:hypothetical protein
VLGAGARLKTISDIADVRREICLCGARGAAVGGVFPVPGRSGELDAPVSRQYRSLDARRFDRLQAQRRGGAGLQRPLGCLGRRRQRRRLRRSDRRRFLRRPEWPRQFRRQLCGVRRGFGLCRQHRPLGPRRYKRLQAQRRAGKRVQRRLGRFGRRRQWRRLRGHHRRRHRFRPRARAGLELCRVWPRVGLCRQHRSRQPRRCERLQDQRRRRIRFQRPLGCLGWRCQRRRLRRPDRRPPPVPARTVPCPGRAMSCSATPRASPPTSVSRA